MATIQIIQIRCNGEIKTPVSAELVNAAGGISRRTAAFLGISGVADDAHPGDRLEQIRASSGRRLKVDHFCSVPHESLVGFKFVIMNASSRSGVDDEYKSLCSTNSQSLSVHSAGSVTS